MYSEHNAGKEKGDGKVRNICIERAGSGDCRG